METTVVTTYLPQEIPMTGWVLLVLMVSILRFDSGTSKFADLAAFPLFMCAVLATSLQVWQVIISFIIILPMVVVGLILVLIKKKKSQAIGIRLNWGAFGIANLAPFVFKGYWYWVLLGLILLLLWKRGGKLITKKFKEWNAKRKERKQKKEVAKLASLHAAMLQQHTDAQQQSGGQPGVPPMVPNQPQQPPAPRQPPPIWQPSTQPYVVVPQPPGAQPPVAQPPQPPQ